MLTRTPPCDSNFNPKVFVLADLTGLVEWKDYIPVQVVGSPVAASADTYNEDGYHGVNSLASDTGLVAWKDYVPVGVVTGRTKPWRTHDTLGYIPVVADVGSLAASEAAAGNVYQAWKGAVEPAFAGGSGNEIQLWKGAVEPGA